MLGPTYARWHRILIGPSLATATNPEGRREIVGFDVVTTEDTEAWTAFLRLPSPQGLVADDRHLGALHLRAARP